MDILIAFETLHSKSKDNYSLVFIKLAEVSYPEEVKDYFDEIYSLNTEDSVKALFIKYRKCVVKTLSSKTKVTRVLGVIL